MARQRKTYSGEFKQQAVRLVTERGQSLAQTARDLSVSDNMLSRWKKQLETQGDRAFPGHGQPHDEELAKLRRELEIARQERDILKKAVGIFSQAPR